MNRLKNNSFGFTLIEILVALAISGIVMAGVFVVFDSSNRSYIIQEDIARLQQNVRIAKYYIEKDLRMAGYGLRNIAFDGNVIDPIDFKNNVQGNAGILDSTDNLTITYMDDEAGDCGTPSFGFRSCSDLPQVLLSGTKPPTSTVAEVKEFMKDNPPYSWWDEDCSCGGTDYLSPSFGYKVIITSPDGSMSDIVFVTGVSAKKEGSDSTISNGPNFTENGIVYSNKQLNTYPDGSTINFFNASTLISIRYFIDKNYYLRREVNGIATKIAENIEDVQISFCGDYNGDNTVKLDFDPTDPDDGNDDWFDEGDLVGGEIPDADKLKIRFARVTILGRTDREHQGIKSQRPGIEDHAGSNQADYYTRRSLSFTVNIRNLSLND